MQLICGIRGLGNPISLTPVEGLASKVRNNLKEHQIAEPAKESIAHNAVAGARSQSGTFHDMANKHSGNQILTAL